MKTGRKQLERIISIILLIAMVASSSGFSTLTTLAAGSDQEVVPGDVDAEQKDTGDDNAVSGDSAPDQAQEPAGQNPVDGAGEEALNPAADDGSDAGEEAGDPGFTPAADAPARNIMVQIKWNDEVNGWNNITRPTEVPADPNELVTLWRYTDDPDNAEQVVLQSGNPSGDNFCRITITEGESIWSCSIGNVSAPEGSHFYAVGPEQDSYKQSERAFEKQGLQDPELKLDYVQYELDYQSLTITKKVIPANADPSFSFQIKVSDSAIPYKGQYTVGNSTRTTNNGTVSGVHDGGSAVITQIPAGVSYKVTEAQADGYLTSYDDGQEGTVAKDGSAEAVVTNISNNLKVSMKKSWNDNNDPHRDESLFRKSLKLEYKLDEGEWAELDADAQTALGIEGDLSYAIDKPSFSNWIVNAAHGGDTNFPAAVMKDDGTFQLISYRIVEKGMEGYISKEENGVINNIKSEDFSAKIKWRDIADKDNRPETVTVTLSAYYVDNNNERQEATAEELALMGVANPEIVLNTKDGDDDTDTTNVLIPDLPSYTREGYPITYFIKQETLPAYSTTYDNGETVFGTNTTQCYNGGTIINIRRDTTTFSATKKWVDAGNDSSANRPVSKVYLYRYVTGQTESQASPVTFLDQAGKTHIMSVDITDTELNSEFSICCDDMAAGFGEGDYQLPKYDTNGREYTYFAKEVLTPRKDENDKSSYSYFKTYLDAEGNETTALFNGGTLINSRTPMVDIRVQKKWISAAFPSAPEGTEVTMKVKVSANDGADWSYVQDADGNDIEITVSGFSSDNLTIGRTVTLPMFNDDGTELRYQVEETSVKKNGNEILNNGQMVIDGHTYRFVPGTVTMADVVESDDPEVNAKADLTGCNVLADNAEYKINKVWNGVTPQNTYVVHVRVTRYLFDGTKDTTFEPVDCEVKGEEGFQNSIANLPLYDASGYPYEYRASETGVTDGDQDVLRTWGVTYDYNYDYVNKIITARITNHQTDGGKYIDVRKTWKDDGCVQDRLPVTAQVYDSEGNPWEGKKVVLSASNGWQGRIGFSAEDMETDAYKNGIIVKEDSVGDYAVDYDGNTDGYTEYTSDDGLTGVVRTDPGKGYVYVVQNIQNQDGSVEIVNRRIGKIQIRIEKDWVDGNRTNEDRPSLSVKVYRDGEYFDTLNLQWNDVVPADNNKWVFVTDLDRESDTGSDYDKYDAGGRQYTYEVKEIFTDNLKRDDYVTEGEDGTYDTSGSKYHSGDVQSFNITNKREGETSFTVYKVWRDTQGTAERPDIRIKLYYQVDGETEIYPYGEGPDSSATDMMKDPIDYVWAEPADPDAVYDSSCTVPVLPKYTSNGAEIHYFCEEEVFIRGDYQTFYWKNDGITEETDHFVDGTPLAGDGEYIENRLEAKIRLNGTKLWMNMQNGTEAESLNTEGIHITLYHYVGENRPDDFEADPSKYEVQTVSLKEASNDNRQFLFSDVDKYDENGKIYSFELAETIDGKMGFVYNNDPSGFRITNTFVTGPENNRTIKVEKDWDSSAYSAAIASAQTDFTYPKAVFQLYRSAGLSEDENEIDFSDEPVAEITVSTENGSYAEKEFPAQLIWSENGVQYKYAVKEIVDGIPAYSIPEKEQTVAIKDTKAFTPTDLPQTETASFTNTYEPKTGLKLKGTKYWKDENNEQLRPDDLTLTVYRRASGTSLSTAISEETLVLNSDYTVEWDKSSESDGVWKYTISGDAITEYAPNGQRWVYRVQETVPEHYQSSGPAAQKGNVSSGVQEINSITNNLDGTYTVSKKWDDNNNEYALRPTSVIVALQKSTDGVNWEYVTEGSNSKDSMMYRVPNTEIDALAVRLSYGDNKWSYTFTNLDPTCQYRGEEVGAGVRKGKDADEDIYPYWMNTQEGNKHMIGSYNIDYIYADSSTLVTNTLEPTTLNITKTWEGDSENYYDSRTLNASGVPTIVVKLQRAFFNRADEEDAWEDITDSNGKTVTQELSSSQNGYTWEIKNLPKCDYLGNNYAYRAVEIEDHVQGYNVDYDYSNSTVTEITNTLIQRDESVAVQKVWREGDTQTHYPVTVELTRWISGDDGKLKEVPYPQPMQVELDGTVGMSANGESGEASAWLAQWNNLPACDNAGNEYTYKVEEVAVNGTAVADQKAAGYLVSVGQTEATTDGSAVEITNTLAMSFKVTKEFKGDQYASRPASITVELQRTTDTTIDDSTEWKTAETKEIKGFNDQTAKGEYTFEDLPKYDADNKEYTYRVVETKIGSAAVTNDFASGYDVAYVPSETDDTHFGCAITNTMRTINIKGTKEWDDQSDYYQLRPENVTVKLFTDGSANAKPAAKQPNPEWTKPEGSNTWTFKFSGLPQYDAAGNRITYYAKETGTDIRYSIENNSLSADFSTAAANQTVEVANGGNGIINKLKVVNVTGTKTWSESLNGSGKPIKPESITLTLMDGTRAVAVPDTSYTLTTTSEPWTYTYANVPEYGKDGKKITYTVTETAVSGYKESRDKTNSGLITNTLDTVDVTAEKDWVDQSNKYSTRPDGWNATDGTGLFTVYADYGDGAGFVKMTVQPTCEWTADAAGNKYTFTAKGLQKYNLVDGNRVDIKYEVREDDDSVPKGYTRTVSDDGKVITNTLDVNSITVTKNWVDNSNAYGTRPAGLTLALQWKTTGDWSDVIGAASVNWTKNGNVWTYTYADMPQKDVAGNTYSYRVVETTPAGYHTDAASASVSSNAAELTNTFDHGYVQITKVFGETGDNGTAAKPLAVFDIKNKTTNTVFRVKTDANGAFVIDSSDGSYTGTDGKKFWLIPGDYTLIEVSSEELTDGCRFAVDTTGYDFKVETDKTTVVTNETSGDTKLFRNKPVRGTLTLTKMDEKYVVVNNQLVEKTDKGELLGSAEFKVCLDGNPDSAALVTLTAAKDGAGNVIAGVYTLPADAQSTQKNELGIPYVSGGKLLCGTYYIIETGVPEGYYVKDSQSPMMITVGAKTAQIVDVTSEMQNTLIEQPFSIAKNYEVPNMAAISTAGTYQAADAGDHKFTFTIERTSDSVPAFSYTKSVSTDADGIADFGNIPYGTYTVTEADTNPYVGKDAFTITVDAAGVKKGTELLESGRTEINNDLKRSDMAGTVVDAEDDTILLAGAVIGLYKDDVCVAQVTTDSNGSFAFSDIPYGEYKIKEEKAPANYEITDTAREVSVVNDGASLTITAIPNQPVKISTALHKVDNEDGHALKDVVFKLSGEDFRGKKVEQTLTTNEDGDLVFDPVPVGEYTLEEEKVTDYEVPHSYTLIVTSRSTEPDGNSNYAEASLTDNDITDSGALPAVNGVYTIENVRIRRDYAFEKTGTDNELDLTAASPLAGAVFGLYQEEDASGTALQEAESDENGAVGFTGLACGTWYVKEIEAPVNYEPNEAIYSITVNQDGSVTSDLETVVNEAVRGSIKLTKVDMFDHERILPGAAYTLYRKNAETEEYEELMVSETDENGEAVFDNLLIGTEYRVEETAAADGYQLSAKTADFVLELEDGAAVLKLTESGDGTVEIDEDGRFLWNESPTAAAFYKVDANGTMLAGAEFTLTDENGKQVVDQNGDPVKWTSSKEEAFTVEGILIAGKTYTLTETKAPDGYKKAEPLTFEVEKVKAGPEEKHVQEIKVVNEKIPPAAKAAGKNTGDNAKRVLWSLLAFCAAGIMAFLAGRKRKNNQTESEGEDD